MKRNLIIWLILEFMFGVVGGFILLMVDWRVFLGLILFTIGNNMMIKRKKL